MDPVLCCGLFPDQKIRKELDNPKIKSGSSLHAPYHITMTGTTRRVSLTDVLVTQGRDWPALEATVMIDGERAAHLKNAGDGGADQVFALDRNLWLELQAIAEYHNKDLQGDAAISALVDFLLLS